MILLLFCLAKPPFTACLLQFRLDLFVSVPARHVVPNVAANRAGFSNITFTQALSPQIICVINDHLLTRRNSRSGHGYYERHVRGTRSRQRPEPPSLAEPPHANLLRVDLLSRFQILDRRKPIVTEFHERNGAKVPG